MNRIPRWVLVTAAAEQGRILLVMPAPARNQSTTPAIPEQLGPQIVAGRGPLPGRAGSRLSLRELLRPHLPALALGLVAVIGEGAANLLEPWPLKIVLDDVLRSREHHAGIMRWIHGLVGTERYAILEFACAAVLAIAILDAICTYTEKYLTTSVGQWVTYDLRLGIEREFNGLRVMMNLRSSCRCCAKQTRSCGPLLGW